MGNCRGFCRNRKPSARTLDSVRTSCFLLLIEQLVNIPDANDAVGACPEGLAAVGRVGASGQQNMGDLVAVELAAGVNVPQPELMIPDTAGEGVAAVGCDRKGADRTSRAVEASDLAARLEVPKTETVVGARKDMVAVR